MKEQDCAVYRFIVRPKTMGLLINLRGHPTDNIRKTALENDITYNHLTKLLVELEHEKLIMRKKIKVAYCVQLTDKGEALSQALKRVKDIVENWERNNKNDATTT